MSLKQLMLPTKPQNWQKGNGNYEGIFPVSQYVDEFDEVVELINKAFLYNYQEVVKIRRVQNCNFYCQFLCRREYLARLPNMYYSVRKFIQIPRSMLGTALQYNLDLRRLQMDKLILHPKIDYVDDTHLLLVVNVLTANPNSVSQPERNNDYYIEYIVDFE